MSYWIRNPIAEWEIPRGRRAWQWYYRTFHGWTFHRWLIELRRWESTGQWPYPLWRRLLRRLRVGIIGVRFAARQIGERE